jgi:hypothetical protein
MIDDAVKLVSICEACQKILSQDEGPDTVVTLRVSNLHY